MVETPRNGKQQYEKLGIMVFCCGATKSGKPSVHYGHILLLVDTLYREIRVASGGSAFLPSLHSVSNESSIYQGDGVFTLPTPSSSILSISPCASADDRSPSLETKKSFSCPRYACSLPQRQLCSQTRFELECEQ